MDYVKSVLLSLIIPVVYLSLWIILIPSTFNEYLLLTHKTKIINGFVTKAEEISDYVEAYEGKKTIKTLYFNFEYSFKLPDGATLNTYGSEDGALPEILSNVHTEPYPVQIEYLSNNPETNRIIASWTGEKSLFGWFRRKVTIGLLGFIVCCFWSYSIFIKGKKN